ncbi:hypothetical protein [Streptomyces sp. PR69]|uniref:hypothetical protein n=1 Tax=Streptomyces sp. PR69 TaxID=2984950 RepID=UPI002264CFC2|nr:hypothetical protein [Streptomyces sp. PR69]
MSPSSHRTACAALLAAAAAAVLSAALSGCGDAGGIESAGPTPTAVGPVRLWPDLPPVTSPPYDFGEGETERVPGVSVPGDDVRRVDPVAVVQAEIRAHPEQYSGADGLYEETAQQIAACTEKPESCPVLEPAYYRDLTGDGKEELIVGITMPEQQTVVRCYMPQNGTLIRIMSTSDQLVSVELADRDVILRSVSAGIPGYEYRTHWSWDDQQQAMLPTRDEIVRVKPSAPTPPDDAAGPAGSPAPGSTPETTPEATPGATPGTASGASPGGAAGTP